MARGINFGQNIRGRLSGSPANGRKVHKATASTLPTPSAGRSALVVGGIGSTFTSARNIASANAARFRRPGRRSNG